MMYLENGPNVCAHTDGWGEWKRIFKALLPLFDVTFGRSVGKGGCGRVEGYGVEMGRD